MPLRIAIVGCGAIAETGHIPAAQRVDAVRLHALVDSDRPRAEALAERFGIPRATATLEDVAGDLDAVVLATPPHVRPALAETAFRRGLHVLCEKPLANSGAEARAIVEAAARSSRILSIGHTCRFFPNRVHVAALLQQRVLGRITTVQLEQGSPYDWPTRSGYTMRQDVMRGGVLLNEGIHSLDTLFWWFGYPEAFDYEDDAVGGLESNARIAVRFPGGISASGRFSRTCRLHNRITIEGDRGSMWLDVYDNSRLWVRIGGKVQTLDLAEGAGDFVDVLAAQLTDFADSVLTRRAPRVTGEDGVRVVTFIDECYAEKRLRPLPAQAPIPGLTW